MYHGEIQSEANHNLYSRDGVSCINVVHFEAALILTL